MEPKSSGEGSATPKFEAPGAAEGQEHQQEKAMERAADGESSVGKKSPKDLNTAVLQLPSDIPAAGPVALPADDSTPAPAGPSAQATDQDSRSFEKQWVEHAKKVIGRTKDDPKAQKQQMNKVKAEYIQKRFNKTIPTEGSASS